MLHVCLTASCVSEHVLVLHGLGSRHKQEQPDEQPMNRESGCPRSHQKPEFGHQLVQQYSITSATSCHSVAPMRDLERLLRGCNRLSNTTHICTIESCMGGLGAQPPKASEGSSWGNALIIISHVAGCFAYAN